jgi:Mn-containing catalase
MFMKALDQMGKLDDPMFGNIPPDDTVHLVFNLSQGEDARGPWNEAPFEYIADPKPNGGHCHANRLWRSAWRRVKLAA